MKTKPFKLTIVLVALLLFQTVYSQEIYYTEANFKYDNEQKIGLTNTIDGDIKSFEKSFTKHFKSKYKIAISNKGDRYYAKEVNMPNISMSRIDIYATIIENKGTLTFSISFAKGYDVFITSKNNLEEFTKMKAEIEGFTKTYYLANYSKYAATIEKQYNSEVKDKSKLEKTTRNNSEKMTQLQKEIVKSEKTIKNNKEEIENLKSENIKNASSILEKEKAADELKAKLINTKEVLKKLNSN